MKAFLRTAAAALLLVAIEARPAAAGMPSIDFTDLGAMRVQAISFFALGLLLSAAFVQAIWNWLRKDFPRLPMLSFRRACAIVALWGLLFVIVLTMISGARELMTPGAWVKNGATYKLASEATDGDIEATASAAEVHKQKQLEGRREKLNELGRALRQYATKHEGRYPDSIETSGLGENLWRLPGGIQMQYKYVPGGTTTAKLFLVAYEPNVFDGQSFGLFADGRIVAMSFDDLLRLLPGDAQ